MTQAAATGRRARAGKDPAPPDGSDGPGGSQQEAPAAAASAGLRYVTDAEPGIRRSRRGKALSYTDPDGRPIRDPETLARIRALAIPPAWDDVWICPQPNGHLQATGRDARGRKQYRYHPRWRSVRDEAKYGRTQAFGQALPAIRERVQHDLALPGLPREKVLAAIVYLLESTLIRVGNEEYARQNGSFGLTSMRDRHVNISGGRLEFRFRGKGGKRHTAAVQQRRLARVVKHCRDIPGQRLFQYIDDEGNRRPVESGDVNAYLREITGQDFTAKDFRTWAGTVLAAQALRAVQAFDSEAQAKREVVRAIESVAAQLGNTPSVCRKCYVHPAVIDAYLEGELIANVENEMDEALAGDADGIEAGEALVMVLLRRRLEDMRQGTQA